MSYVLAADGLDHVIWWGSSSSVVVKELVDVVLGEQGFPSGISAKIHIQHSDVNLDVVLLPGEHGFWSSL